MAIQVQYRRGTTSENNAFTGALAEITVDTTTNTLRVHDGVTAGGFSVAGTTATQTLTNKTLSAPTFTGALTGNLVPSTDNTYTLGNATSSWSALYVAGNTIYLGNLQLKESGPNTFAVFTSDGVTQANLDVGNIDVSALTQGTSTIGLAGVNGNAYITVAGTANVLVVSNTGANVTGTLNASGNANVGNLGTAGLITATGNITGGNLVTDGQASVTGNVTGGNLVTGGLITATGNITGGNLITAGLISASGNITGNFILGNGSQLTGIDATSIQSGTSNVRVVSSGGNVTVGIAGTSNVAVFSSAGANITGTLGVSGNANVGNLGTAGLITATGNITGGNLVTTGNISGGNLKVTGIEAVTTLTVSGDTLISGNLTVSGTTITANVASLVVTDPILGLGRGANGAPLTSNDGLDRGIEMFYYTNAEQTAFMGYDNSAGKMISAANTSIANNIVTVNSYGTTVVGTLESTVVIATGNVSGGNITTAGLVSATGNVTGGNITTGGQVVATGNVSGGNLNVTGNIVDSGPLTIITGSNGNITFAPNGGGHTIANGNLLANMIFTVNSIPSGANINLSGYNGIMAGPITIANGASFTVTTVVTIV